MIKNSIDCFFYPPFMRFMIIGLTLVTVGCEKQSSEKMNLLNNTPSAFYVWQRLWTPAVCQAVAAEKGPLYILAAELDKKGVVSVSFNREACRSAERVTPVFRIHSNWINRADLIPTILKAFAKLPSKTTALQLDLDCPESKLSKYHSIVKKLKKQLPPNLELSITALPCHLNNRAFEKLITELDYYVLQIHGISIPKNYKDKCQLVDFTVSEQALRKAFLLNSPFKLALPTYGYRLQFSKADNSFIRLSAENRVQKNDQVQEKIITTDLSLLTQFLTKTRNKNSNYRGIIWFRLPTTADELTISRSAISTLASGHEPNQELALVIEKSSDGRVDVFIRNNVCLKIEKVVISLYSQSRIGDYDLARDFYTKKELLPGLLPSTITGSIPSPGSKTFVGWFRPNKSEKLKLEIKCLTKN